MVDEVQVGSPKIVDNLGEVDIQVPYRYTVSSYGADYPVDSLVNRLNVKAIYIPSFQRNYVWKVRQASRFLESLLLGLPVPGIFLSKDFGTQRLFVVDGQQRLKTLQYFYAGVFADSKKEFALIGVQPNLEGKTYRTLPEDLQRLLDDSIIHATIIKQDEPSNDRSSIYNVFERLNTGATPLSSQEIRASVYNGPFIDLLGELNQDENWRSLFFLPLNPRMRDHELILRFFALYFARSNYQRPMEAFLNEFIGLNRKFQRYDGPRLTRLFLPTVRAIYSEIGLKAFKPQGSFNAAVFDSVMIAVAELIENNPDMSALGLQSGWDRLFLESLDNEYIESTVKATADPISVDKRIELARIAFGLRT